MYYCINKDNYIEAYSEEYISIESCQTIQSNEDIDFNKSFAYVFENEKLVFSQELYEEVMNESEIVQLRTRREEECFSIINRGEAWYTINVNTDERKEELNDWYNDWLNVTETKVIPEKPCWIN